MISCSDYDHIEIVCMYRYPIQLILKSGDLIEGTAIDTKRDNERRECIELEVDGATQLQPLDELKSLIVLISNPHFEEITF